jgi:fermentation-respiration switch protein FrsA (DUF1100 family)
MPAEASSGDAPAHFTADETNEAMADPTSRPRFSTRRAFLGGTAVTAAGCITQTLSARRMSGHGSADLTSPQRIRFDAGDSFIVGNLFLPPGNRPDAVYPAVVVGGSLTSVKEQMGGTYAAEMAKRGFIALAIDYRRYGESGGEPRQYENPDDKAVDLSAAVAHLASRPDVRPGAVALLGICTSGGNVLYAAARDRRIGAVATVAAHFAEPSVIASLPVYGGPETIERHRAEGRAARAKYERTGENILIVCYDATDPGAGFVGPLVYYFDKTRGGGVRGWNNAFAVMSWEPWLEFNPVSEAAKVSAPTLIIHSDGCVMPDQARKVHALLKGPKALRWTTGNHFDFYDGPEKVRESADAIAEHFRTHLV